MHCSFSEASLFNSSGSPLSPTELILIIPRGVRSSSDWRPGFSLGLRRNDGGLFLCARQGALTNGLKFRAGLPWEPQDCGDGGCLSDKTRSVRGNREPHFLVPRRFQWVDLQDRLSPTASGSQQPGVPIALKGPASSEVWKVGTTTSPTRRNSPNFDQ